MTTEQVQMHKVIAKHFLVTGDNQWLGGMGENGKSHMLAPTFHVTVIVQSHLCNSSNVKVGTGERD